MSCLRCKDGENKIYPRLCGRGRDDGDSVWGWLRRKNRPLWSDVCQEGKCYSQDKAIPVIVVSSTEGIGARSESIQFSALATPLFEDWIPQANGQTGSSIIPQRHESHDSMCHKGRYIDSWTLSLYIRILHRYLQQILFLFSINYWRY